MPRKLYRIFDKLVEHGVTFVFQHQGRGYNNIALDVPEGLKKATKKDTIYFNSPHIEDVERVAVEMYGHLLEEKVEEVKVLSMSDLF